MKKCVKLLSSLLIVLLITVATLSPISASAQGYMRGIDVSENNGYIDFAMLKSQGYDYAMIRLGYYNHLDAAFYQNVKAACDAGMIFGVYLYSYAFNDAEVQIEADFVLNTLAALDPAYKAKMFLPVAYDLEDQQILDNNCGKPEITNHALIFSNALKAAGYTPMIYANDNWFKNYIDMNTLYQNDIKIWYAYWTNDPNNLVTNVIDTNIPCYMWQYTSNTIDQNIVYFNYDIVSPNPPVTPTPDPPLIPEPPVTPPAPPAVIPASKLKVTLSTTSYTYNGKTRKPSVTVKDSNGAKISSGNYSVSYAKVESM